MNNQTLYVAVALILLAFLFYWYGIRPANIRAGCENKVLHEKLYATSTVEKEQLNGDMNKINSYEREKSRYYYEECLHLAGLSE